jgi:signal transduction histidine kinase
MLASCSHTSLQQKVTLSRADSLMKNHPDSAFNLLKTIVSPLKLASSDKAYYALLMTTAVDKCNLYDQVPALDSLIKIAIQYYTQTNDADKAANSYFYFSRCEQYQENSNGQLGSLLCAIPYAIQANNNKLLGFIYGDIASVYETQQNKHFNSVDDEKSQDTTFFEKQQKDKMLYYNKLSLLSFQKAKDTRNYAISLLDVGNNYYQLNQFDSALIYCDKAKPILFSLQDTMLNTTLYRLMAGIFFEQKEYNKALTAIKQSMQSSDNLDYNKWFVYARICIQMNALDSARLYLKKCIKSGHELPHCYQLLQKIAEKQGHIQRALGYAKLSIAAKDSIDQHSFVENFAGMEKKYNYEKVVVENKKLIIRNQRYLMGIAMIFIICFVIAVFFFVEQNHKKKLANLDDLLQKTIESKDKFFSIISHDLRNPSYSIKQLAEQLYLHIDQLEKDKVKCSIQLLIEAAKQNNQLMENLLFWAITQREDFSPNPTDFDIREVIENCIGTIQADAELKHIRIITQLQHRSLMHADRNMIEMVLRNVVSNAIKFSNENQQITIKTSETERKVIVWVVDQGIGMEPEEVGRLFRIDSILKKEGTHGEKGTGLGLILCYEFIKKNNGNISVQSNKEQGTTFTFELPKQ